MAKPIPKRHERVYAVRSIPKFVFILLLLFTASIAYAATTTGIFWFAASASDTALVERIAPIIAGKLSERVALLSPDFLRDRYGDTLFEKSSTARSRFRELFPEAIRLEFHFQRFGNSSTMRCYRIEPATNDSLRLFYSGANTEVADWFEFYFDRWFFGASTDIKKIGNASIVVDGTPLGAMILLDGEPTGERLPATLTKLAPGVHLIELTGNLRATQKVRALENSSVGITLRGKPVSTLLEVVSDPPGLPVEIEGVSSGYTPYLRESAESSLTITVGGGDRERITRLIDLEPGEWRTLAFTPQFMYRVAARTFPPGAVIYDGPVRIGVDGDTLPCSPNGEEWTVDHPFAFPKTFKVAGKPDQIPTIVFQLPPALAYLNLRGWYYLSSLRVGNDVIAVTKPDSQEVLAGKKSLEIVTPGFRTRRSTVTLERGALVLVEASPIPAPSWRTAALSAVVPGLGQYIDGSPLRAGAFFATAVFAFASWQSSEQLVDDRIASAQSAEIQYRKSLSMASAKMWSATADSRWQSAEDATRMRDQWATIVAVVWASSALERLIFPTKALQPVPVGSGAGVKLSLTLPGGNG